MGEKTCSKKCVQTLHGAEMLETENRAHEEELLGKERERVASLVSLRA